MSEPDPITRLKAALSGRYTVERELVELLSVRRLVSLARAHAVEAPKTPFRQNLSR